MKITAVFISVFFFLANVEAQRNKIISTRKGYKLAWSDEFNKDGVPDSIKWGYEKGFVRNHEIQWYQKDNAFCENGVLVIEARKTSVPNPLFDPKSADWRKQKEDISYTSASLNTRGKFAWQYGIFEMRARIDIREGLWPAWWTLGVTKPWPANGEVDIMEYYNGKLLANLAAKVDDGKIRWIDPKYNVDSMGGQTWASLYHIWKLEWDEECIKIYVDDFLLNEVSLNQFNSKTGSGFNPFRQPHYMLLNLAIGGDNGGDPQHTTFPSRYEIDYVRVYQKKSKLKPASK